MIFVGNVSLNAIANVCQAFHVTTAIVISSASFRSVWLGNHVRTVRDQIIVVEIFLVLGIGHIVKVNFVIAAWCRLITSVCSEFFVFNKNLRREREKKNKKVSLSNKQTNKKKSNRTKQKKLK